MRESFRIRRKYRIVRAASLCPGSGAGGSHDRFPSRSSKADRRSTAPERRRTRSEGEGPIPYGSRTRVAAARRRASFVADYPRRGQASPLQLSLPKGQRASPKSRDRQAAGNFVTPSLTVGRTSLLRIVRTERQEARLAERALSGSFGPERKRKTGVEECRYGRRTTRSISTSAPTASAVTPTVVRAGSLPGSQKLGHSALSAA